MITQIGRWIADDRTFPYAVGVLALGGSLVGAGLGLLGAWTMDRLAPQWWADPIEWEGVE